MREHKIKTKALAEKTGIDVKYLDHIRGGRRRPSPEKAKLISDAIGINVLDLLYPEPETNPAQSADQEAV
jgi:transcriptional regulator with XRE-family HTH domain